MRQQQSPSLKDHSNLSPKMKKPSQAWGFLHNAGAIIGKQPNSPANRWSRNIYRSLRRRLIPPRETLTAIPLLHRRKMGARPQMARPPQAPLPAQALVPRAAIVLQQTNNRSRIRREKTARGK